MDEEQSRAVKEIRKQLHNLEGSLSAQAKLLEERKRKMASLSLSVAVTGNFVEESEEELKVAQTQLEDTMRKNRLARTEKLRAEGLSENRLPRDEYMKELSEAELGLKDAEKQMQNLVDQVKTLGESSEDAHTKRRIFLMNLISMLDDLHASLARSVLQVPLEEDNRAREVFKAIRELSRERERAIGYCLRKKREVECVIELKKQRANALILDSRKNASVECKNEERSTLSVVDKIQTERKILEEEIESIKIANQRLWDAIKDTKYSSDAIQSGNSRRETAMSANEVLQGSAAVEEEKLHLREQLKLFYAKKDRLQRMTDELKSAMGADMQQNTERLKNMRQEVHSQQRMSQMLEKENQKLKSLCDSLAETLQTGR